MNLSKIILPVLIAIVVLIAAVSFAFWVINPFSGDAHLISKTTATSPPIVRELDSLSEALENAEGDVELLKEQIGQKVSGYDFLNHGIGTSMLQIVKGYNDIHTGGKGKYFLLLNYLGLKKGTASYAKFRFYTERGTGYLSSLSYSGMRNGKERVYEYSNFKKVDYLYSNVDRREGILIPLQSPSLINVFKVSIWLLALAYLFAFAFVLVHSIAVLFNISRNKAFAEINIFRLKWCAIILLTMLVVPYLVTGIFYLFYFNRLSPEVTFTHSFFDSDYNTLIVGLVYWLLFQAFRKGYKLQQENEFTV